MAKKSAQVTTVQEIEQAIYSDAAAFLAAFRKRRSKETMFGFLFEVSSVGYAIHVAIGTEESLAKAAEELVDDFDGDLDRAKAELRWAGVEDGWHQSADKDVRNANKLLDIAETIELYPEYDGTLESIALKVLAKMDAEGLFGEGKAREQIVLGVCHTGGDNSEKDFIKWASQVNPPGVIKRLKKELKARS